MIAGVPPSRHFVVRNGALHADEVSLDAIAREHGTPTFVYAARAIDDAYRAIDDALREVPHLITYAVKANGNLAILDRLARLGAGADIVSIGELHRALRGGIAPDRIVFSGVGKRLDEIREALEVGIRSIHAESGREVEHIESVAASLGKVAPISLRVNPNVDPKTHPYIATGLRGSKFGISVEEAEALVPRILASKHLQLEGVAMHIGSQLGGPEPLRDAVTILGAFAKRCVAAGAKLHAIDVGGGWPMAYGHEENPYPPPSAFGAAILEGLRASGADRLGVEIVTEPGRALVGDAGVLLTRVQIVKDQGDKRFVIVDAAMTDLIRPALYQSYHAIVPVRARDGARAVDVVGPVCESGDFLARDRQLPTVEEGDLLVVRGAGAYGREMASTYNARPLVAEVLVDGHQVHLVRPRGTIESLFATERIPGQS